ncbi:MAG: cytochrome c oxidase assembly protein [Longimicrobiales bacterium]
MQWWCAAQNVAWTWTWRPYPGVWLFVAAFALVFVAFRGHARSVGVPVSRTRAASFFAGLLLMWIALDWPVGALGAGYLASLHMVQFLVLALFAPPLMVHGLEPAALTTLRLPRDASRVLSAASHPIVSLVLFSAIIIATHLPVVTDRLMPSQWGAFLIDTLWILGGTLYWWPLIVPVPHRPWFQRPVKMAYLFASMVIMTAPGAMLTFSVMPIYATYELAPPIPGVSAIDDQRIAGIGMRFGGSLVAWIAISVLFFRWSRDEERMLRKERTGLGRRPR